LWKRAWELDTIITFPIIIQSVHKEGSSCSQRGFLVLVVQFSAVYRRAKSTVGGFA